MHNKNRKHKKNKIIEAIKTQGVKFSEALGKEGRRAVLEKLPIKVVLRGAVKFMNPKQLETLFKQYDEIDNKKCIKILIGYCEKKKRPIPKYITEKYK